MGVDDRPCVLCKDPLRKFWSFAMRFVITFLLVEIWRRELNTNKM